jgi:lipopolysaccharide transport system ATP-binding protein
VSAAGEIAIEAVGLAKLYRLGERASRRSELVRALDDVSFQIPRGQVVGIVGGNGAGKSTLLKVLSRITPPTRGWAEIRGRVGSLLEVGTGFHPELSGRENVFLNGAILGMRRAEVAARFDEIVAFAEVERFLDTPVKRYSSGMRVRLAFAVAAHLEPEVLILDEVLSVGDAPFQARCLRRMSEVARSGRTVLFVSHNLATVRHLCPRVLQLRAGRVVRDGPPDEVIEGYLAEALDGVEAEHPERANIATPDARIDAVELLDARGEPMRRFQVGEPLVLRVALEATRPVESPCVYVGLRSADGAPVAAGFQNLEDGVRPAFRAGRNVFELRVEGLHLRGGRYFANVCVHLSDRITVIAWRRQLDAFEIESPVKTAGTAELPHHWRFEEALP